MPKINPITRDDFIEVCHTLFSSCTITDTGPNPWGNVYTDCMVDGKLKLRFVPEDKYMDNHVVMFGDGWTNYCYSRRQLEIEAAILIEK